MKKFFTILFMFLVFSLIQNSALTQTNGKFPVWQTVLGTNINSADGFRGALRLQSYKIDDMADFILGKIIFPTDETKLIKLVKVSMKDLGLKDDTTGIDIYKKAVGQGLQLCPREVGPRLALQYMDQPNGDEVVVASEPIAGPSAMPVSLVFRISRLVDGVHLLEVASGDLNHVWHPSSDTKFIFMLP